MKIVIVGDGKVGSTLAEQLSKENHDIVIIDQNPSPLRNSMDKLDVISILGNGASYTVQMQADVGKSDILIAATSSDEVNMICCLLARKLGARHTIARIRNPEYDEQLRYLKDELGLSMVINPERATAVDISRAIYYPKALSINTFAKGKISVIELKIDPASQLVGQSISSIHKKHTVNILIGAVTRGGEVFIPDGDFIIKAGDRIHICGENKKIAVFLRSASGPDRKVKMIIIIGGSRICYYLTRILLDTGIDVRIIEKSAERCKELSQVFPDALIIEGDGTDQDILESEGLGEADALVALMDYDEENFIVSMYASKCGVPKTIAKINRLNYYNIIQNAGIDKVVSPKFITASQIVQYVRAMQNALGSQVKTLYRIADEKAEVVEFIAGEHTKHLEENLADLKLRKNTLVIAIARHDKIITPHGKDYISKGDNVIVITTGRQLNDLNDIFAD